MQQNIRPVTRNVNVFSEHVRMRWCLLCISPFYDICPVREGLSTRRKSKSRNVSLSVCLLHGQMYYGEFCVVMFLADPGEAGGWSTNTSVTHWFIDSFSHPLVPAALRRRHAQTVRDSSSSYKTDNFIVKKNFLNLKWHQNHITGTKVTAILMKEGRLCLLVELHWEGSAPAACAAQLFQSCFSYYGRCN